MGFTTQAAVNIVRSVAPGILHPAPETIYHYTTPRGLLGILSSRGIWASHIRYLNDAAEFSYAMDLARPILAATWEANRESDSRSMLAKMADQFNSQKMPNTFVVSFSEDGDLLSQWRSYSGKSGGSAIGFSSQLLEGQARNHGFVLAECIYDLSAQNQLVQTFIDTWITISGEVAKDSGNPRDQGDSGLATAFLLSLTQMAPLLKHPSFSEEREWRLISPDYEGIEKSFCFRPTETTLVPYIEFPLAQEGSLLPINELIVGPTPHPENAKSACRAALSVHGLEGVKIKSSVTPFRSW